MSAKIISVVSQKGGVTKSTTCINLGVGLARHGKRVLLVDNDPQGSMTISLGFQHPKKIAIKTNDMLSKIILKLPIEPGEGILRNAEGVDLMPSGIELAAMEMNMTDEKERETIMKRYLETVRFMYDFIIIDCMPSLSLLTINALAAADYLDEALFCWKRVSSDATADELWNAAHRGLKTITLTVRDVLYSATYTCELQQEE